MGIPEIDLIRDGLLVVQQRLAGKYTLEQARFSAVWNANLWVLPLCPPTNSLFPGKARRYKSKAYKEWEQLAEAYWLYQVVQKREVGVATGHHPTDTFAQKDKQKWSLDVYNFMPTYRDGDLDGRLKALIDWLCKATGHDDRYLMRLHAERITNASRLKGTAVMFGGYK